MRNTLEAVCVDAQGKWRVHGKWKATLGRQGGSGPMCRPETGASQPRLVMLYLVKRNLGARRARDHGPNNC